MALTKDWILGECIDRNHFLDAQRCQFCDVFLGRSGANEDVWCQLMELETGLKLGGWAG